MLFVFHDADAFRIINNNNNNMSWVVELYMSCGTVSILIAEMNLLKICIIQNNLQCLNVGNNWTFQGPMGKSIIDITLSNYSLANKISDWKVENYLEVSDLLQNYIHHK